MTPIFDMRPTGRLCVRMAAGGFVTTGVLHFPSSFRPEEGTAYPLLFNGGTLDAAPIALGRIPEDVVDSAAEFDVEEVKTLPLWAILAQQEAAVKAQQQAAEPDGP